MTCHCQSFSKSGNMYQVVNMTCSASLKAPIARLEEIPLPHARYNPRRFSAIFGRFEEHHTTALVFKSGKIITAGSLEVAQAEAVVAEIAAMCRQDIAHFAVTNIASRLDVGFRVAIDRLANENNSIVKFEPELSTSCVIRTPTAVSLLHFSGRGILTSIKSIEDIPEAANGIVALVAPYKL